MDVQPESSVTALSPLSRLCYPQTVKVVTATAPRRQDRVLKADQALRTMDTSWGHAQVRVRLQSRVRTGVQSGAWIRAVTGPCMAHVPECVDERGAVGEADGSFPAPSLTPRVAGQLGCSGRCVNTCR